MHRLDLGLYSHPKEFVCSVVFWGRVWLLLFCFVLLSLICSVSFVRLTKSGSLCPYTGRCRDGENWMTNVSSRLLDQGGGGGVPPRRKVFWVKHTSRLLRCIADTHMSRLLHYCAENLISIRYAFKFCN